jgi:hypothetical protein
MKSILATLALTTALVVPGTLMAKPVTLTANPPFPATVSGEFGLNQATMPALADIPVSQLRSLTFPYAGDPVDVYTITTDQGEGFVDQGTGAMLVWQDAGTWQKVNEFIYLLHTGQGAWGFNAQAPDEVAIRTALGHPRKPTHERLELNETNQCARKNAPWRWICPVSPRGTAWIG